MWGGSSRGLELAALMAHWGISVTVIEPDRSDAERIAHFLRGAGDRLSVAARLDGQQADVVVDASEEAASVLGANTLFLCTDLARLEDLPHSCGFMLSSPASQRRLVEVTPDAEGAYGRAWAFALKLGRVPVLAPRGRESVAGRLAAQIDARLEALLMAGGVPHEIDEALVAKGFAIGPFEAQDLTGLDIARDARTARGDHTHLISDRMVAEGRLGKKVGVGWYRYPGGGGSVIDPLVEDLAREEAHFAGFVPRHVSGSEAYSDILTAIAKEGRALLDDATAPDSATLEQVAVFGLGLPSGQVNWR